MANQITDVKNKNVETVDDHSELSHEVSIYDYNVGYLETVGNLYGVDMFPVKLFFENKPAEIVALKRLKAEFVEITNNLTKEMSELTDKISNKKDETQDKNAKLIVLSKMKVELDKKVMELAKKIDIEERRLKAVDVHLKKFEAAVSQKFKEHREETNTRNLSL